MRSVNLLAESVPPSALAIPPPPASEDGESREFLLKMVKKFEEVATLTPADMVDALQDTIHTEVGRSRAVCSSKKYKGQHK